MFSRRSLTFLVVCILIFANAPAVYARHLLAARSLSGRLFVVDPGHGVRTPAGAPLNVGAVGPHGVQEQKVALELGDKVAALLRGAGARVVMTRTDARPYRFETDRRRDNRSRATLANALGATAFLALHCDSSLDPSKAGTSVFWLRANSAALARAVRAHLAPLALGESEFHPRDLAVTREARVPAVLVELGFVSNPRQESLLASRSFQMREAQALFDAIMETFGS
jgi:N-acetylmuramoyl-L-alanine amidase